MIMSSTPALSFSAEEFSRSRSGESLTLEGGRGDWRIRSRIRTVSAGIILCLHLGVDPPDVHRTSPASRLECWTEPTDGKAKENIAKNLQQQYEFWQPRVRYKILMDPNTEDVRKLCQTLRKSAKDERILLHYNGHGVPRATRGGELWVFNKQFTQYIPVSVSEMSGWAEGPALLVLDCSAAGNIYNVYRRIAEGGSDILVLAACGADEVLPMAPEMPADIFTACLTTPMEIAIRWHVYRSGPLMPDITLEMAMSITGRLGDRRSPLGELNWILTAITDTIAWTILPREIFKRLFRQDVLVASMFRNFLLAVRILKGFRCNAISWPLIPGSAVANHEMWQAWDQALDCCLAQTSEPNSIYEPSTFFSSQLDAFELWIQQRHLMGSPPCTTPHLAILLQVLLSQTDRSRALQLLGHFADLGEWAVLDCLHVGIFPYLLKLFQSPATDIRYPLLYLWLRIAIFDRTVSVDLRKDGGYLIKTLIEPLEEAIDQYEIRSMALACLCLVNSEGGASIMSGDPFNTDPAIINRLMAELLGFASSAAPQQGQWSLLGLSMLVNEVGNQREIGIGGLINQSIPALLVLITHERRDNRSAIVHLFGCLLARGGLLTESSELEVIYALLECVRDCHPPVRRELVISLSKFVSRHSKKFILAAYDLWNGRRSEGVVAPGGGDIVRHPGIFTLIWKTCLILSADPQGEVSQLACRLVDEIHMGFMFASSTATATAMTGAGGCVTPPQVIFVNDHGSVSDVDQSGVAMILNSAIPLESNLIVRSALSLVEHQRRRRTLIDRKQGNLVQARLHKLQQQGYDEATRWMEMEEKRFDHCIGVLSSDAPLLLSEFHPLQDYLVMADAKGTVSVWDYGNDHHRIINQFSSSPSSKITGLICLDYHPVKLLVGSADGMVRVYEGFEEGTESLHASWAFHSSQFLFEWNQHQRRLYSLCSKELSVFDAAREQIIQTVGMKEGGRPTALTSDHRESPIITIGFSDGWIRWYDLRQPDRYNA